MKCDCGAVAKEVGCDFGGLTDAGKSIDIVYFDCGKHQFKDLVWSSNGKRVLGPYAQAIEDLNEAKEAFTQALAEFIGIRKK